MRSGLRNFLRSRAPIAGTIFFAVFVFLVSTMFCGCYDDETSQPRNNMENTGRTAAASGGTVSGAINVNGSVITLSPGNYSTGSAGGKWTISNVSPGNYTISATAAGYINYASGSSIQVSSNKTTTKNITMTSIYGRVNGVINDNGAVITLSPGGYSTVSANGYYLISNVPYGNYTLTAIADSCNYILFFLVHVDRRCNYDGKYYRDPYSRKCQGNLNVNGALITLSPGNYSTVSAGGKYAISGVPVGNYTLNAIAANYPNFTTPSTFLVYSNTTTTKNITMTGGNDIFLAWIDGPIVSQISQSPFTTVLMDYSCRRKL